MLTRRLFGASFSRIGKERVGMKAIGWFSLAAPSIRVEGRRDEWLRLTLSQEKRCERFQEAADKSKNL